MFRLFGLMIRGEFNVNDESKHKMTTVYLQLFIYVLTLFANVLLLNLIIAIMGDAYEEVITSVEEKNLK